MSSTSLSFELFFNYKITPKDDVKLCAYLAASCESMVAKEFAQTGELGLNTPNV